MIGQIRLLVGIVGFLLLFSVARADESLCAVVRIEIQQELTLERQGFDAQMKIGNTLDTVSMEDIEVVVQIQDESGHTVSVSNDPNDQTARFFVRVSTIEGLQHQSGGVASVSGDSFLSPRGKGEIHWLIVPAQKSGGETSQGKVYFVGAELRFKLEGEEQSLSVAPAQIRVKPMPLLKLDYFLTHDVIADDAFTPEKEASEPFTLGIRIVNGGSGIAQSVKIESAQPRIVGNEQGVPIDFRILGSHVNDAPVSESLLLDFGAIPSGQAAVGRWIMETDHAGRFTEFRATWTHAAELGGEMTSLIESVNTWHLVRDVRVDLPGRDSVRDFLAHSGGEQLRLFESDGSESLEVQTLSAQTTLTVEDTQAAVHRWRLNLPEGTTGFVYTQVADPYQGERQIVNVIRNDGKVLSEENVWLSKKRKADPTQGWDHFINLFDAGGHTTYHILLESMAVGNQSPVIAFLPQQTTHEGGSLTFEIKASDPEGAPVFLTATSLPAGASFSDQGSGQGIFSWSPGIGQKGLHTVGFQASDGALTAQRNVQITVFDYYDRNGNGIPDAWEMEHFGELIGEGTGDSDGDGLSDYEEYLLGTNPTLADGPVAPEIHAPQDYGRIATQLPQLVVKNSPRLKEGQIHTYQFELYTDAQRTHQVGSQLNQTEGEGATGWQVSQTLNDNSWYYWSARVYNGFLLSSTVNGRFFVNTANDAPEAAELSLPARGATVQEIRPVMTVVNGSDVDEDPLSYRFEIYSDAELTALVVASEELSEGELGTTSWKSSIELQQGATYYWRATVSDPNGLSAASEVFDFRVEQANTAPNRPVIIAPGQGTTVTEQSVGLIALRAEDPDGDEVVYQFELSPDPGFSQALQSGNVLDDGQQVIWAVSDLADNTQWYWRVKSVDTHQAASDWSYADFFVNVANDPPSQPIVVNPQSGSWVDSLTPLLEVTESVDVDRDVVSYRFEVYADGETGERLLEGESPTPRWYVAQSLQDNIWVRWRARAEDAHGGSSDWTPMSRIFVNENGINDAPTILLLEPQGEIRPNAGHEIVIRWSDSDPDSNARISLYVCRDAQALECDLIVEDLEEDPDGEDDSYRMDVSGWMPGDYWVRAVIQDEESESETLSPGYIRIDRTVLTLDNDEHGTVAQGEWQRVTDASGFYGSDYRTRAGNQPKAADGWVLDNQIAMRLGNWVSSTGVAGYHGADYEYHGTDNPLLGAIVVDNGGTGYHAEGNWVSSTWVGGFYGADYHYHAAGQLPPDTTIVDNTAADFSLVGNWIASNSVKGHEGEDYLYHAANAESPDAMIVDNGDALFAVTGEWVNSTGVGGYQGEDYLYHAANGMPSGLIVIDNTDPRSYAEGAWSHSNSVRGYEGEDYRYRPKGAGDNRYVWGMQGVEPGEYRLYARWTSHSNRASNARYTIIHAAGTEAAQVNQRINGGTWQLLTTVMLTGAEGERVMLSDLADNYVIADAIALLPVDAPANSASWTFAVSEAVQGELYARWTAHSNRATNAVYTVHHHGGTTQVEVDQTVNGGSWQPLGEFTLSADGHNRVVLTDQANGYVIADAVKFVPENAQDNRAVWKPVLQAEERLAVYAKWTAHENRASNAQYKIWHAEGVSTVSVDQRKNGGQWQLLGTWSMHPDQSHRIELSDRADGYVIADAIALVPEGAQPNRASWTPTLAESGDYDIYARWTSNSNRASHASYTIHHAGGETTVVVNQQQSSQKWNHLGRFVLYPEQGHRVVLTDQADGYVIADAVSFVPAGNVPVMSWEAQGIDRQAYEVYARWTAHSNRAVDARYTVHDVSGHDTYEVNQKIRGGQWNLLGVHTLESGSKIELSGLASGYVVGDAVLLIPVAQTGEDYQWKPDVPVDGLYRVSVRWPAANHHAEQATWHISSGLDYRTVTVNQRLRGGEWVELGEVYVQAQEGIDIRLSGRAEGALAADAVRLEWLAAQP